MRSGAGGNGCVSFRREKHVPRGGPDGGDGGRGGDVTLRASAGVHSLLDCRYKRHYRAGRGGHGRGGGKNGKSGEDIVVRVPVGTVVRREKNGGQIADLAAAGQAARAAKGGKGGRGNGGRATPTNQAPRLASDGESGEKVEIFLELKLLADVGIAGFPNAGKSTLIAKASAAKPKIADYPFTTLVPNLGVVRWGDHKTFTMADIPGIIPGASGGAGLGLRFLRHVERTRVIIHMTDMSPFSGRNPLEDYEAINSELRLYDPALAGKPQIVALNKTDIPESAENTLRASEFFRDKNIKAVAISAMTGAGVQTLVNETGAMLEKIRNENGEAEPL